MEVVQGNPFLVSLLLICPDVLFRLDYCDEAMKDPGQAAPVDIHQPPAFVHKVLQLSGVLLYYEELTDGGARVPSPAPKV